MTELSGRRFVITGASRGIGRSIAWHLAAAGARVALVAQSAERLSAAQTALPSGAVSVSIAADLRDPGASDIVRERVIRPWGGIDGLVNCAGAAKVGDFLAFNEADWDDGFALKFSAARRLSQRFWSDLAASSGVIVNIVGSAGRTPGADYVLAGSVNSAMLGLTKALAARGIRDGVRVNAINPGPIETDRLRGHIERIAREQGIDEGAARASLQATYGVTRFGAPEDVAALVRYVVSPAGRMLHGAIIDIDGGLTKTI